MSGIKVPCHNCEQRHIGCHSECEAYANYCKENAEKQALIYSKKAEEAEVCKYIASRMNKMRKAKERTK